MADDDTTRAVEPLRHSGGSRAIPDPGQVIREEVLTVEIEAAGTYTLLCTPVDAQALAAGFALTGGFIQDRSGIRRLSHRRGHPSDNLPSAGDTLRVGTAWVKSAMKKLHENQELFPRTGGAHAAAVISSTGDLLAFAEDIGRHNALDKTIGKCLLDNLPTAGCAVCLSSRISFDLVAKAARAGLELIAAVSAPSSMAIDTAEKTGITLCAFVREDRFSVYTHPHRVRNP